MCLTVMCGTVLNIISYGHHVIFHIMGKVYSSNKKMDQDWTTVTLRKKKTVHTYKHYDPELIRIAKLAQLDDPCPKKCIEQTSLQELIRTRIKMNLSQEKADVLCSFPHNTFKHIESKHLYPTDSQKRRIQMKCNVYLKTVKQLK